MDSAILNVDQECLILFIDDTGHEKLADKHPVYGLGGCAVLASDLDRAINAPWGAVREQVTGFSDAPLHASSFSLSPTKEQISAVAAFFKQPTFMRFAAVASTTTQLPAEIELIDVVLHILGRRIQELAERVPLSSAAVIFEHSQRAKNLIERYFTGFVVAKDGHTVPTDLLWMAKSANQPGMEVADFVMHAVHRQERKATKETPSTIKQTPDFNLDFEAVFTTVPSRLISFQRIGGVIGDYPNEIVVGYELR